ncbi:helix-turn-helix domain-containing protein [Streptomyces sp. G45]|uniref:helix-turn-helix domain-containing protein n=1 Tax=Streptomyces sp. G45 TaxID=3406627 RepID=UPI003C1A36AF
MRRRSRGLRQEDVAILCRVSTRWYAAFERGECATQNEALLNAIAHVLKMDHEEISRLYLLTVGSDPPDTRQGLRIPPELVSFVRRQSPHPSLLLDSSWNLLAWNTPAAEWFEDFSALDEEDRNFAVWVFGDAAAQRFAAVAEERAAVVAELRVHCARRPWDQDLRSVVSKVMATGGEARGLWREQRLRVPPACRVRRLRHPHRGVRDLLGVTCRLPAGMQFLTHSFA